MLGAVVRRLARLLATLIGLTVIVFLLMNLVPGDPARLAAGMAASQEMVDKMREELRLDQPLAVRYMHFLANAVRGDLGRSWVSHQPIGREVFNRWAATLQLALFSTVLVCVFGLAMGVACAIRPGGWLAGGLRMLSTIGVSVASFWLGLVLILTLSVRLGWFPSIGKAGLSSFVLPALSVALYGVGVTARQTETALAEALLSNYIRTAWAKGLPQRAVIFKHALKNALIPVVTVLGLQFGYLMGSSVVVEVVFAWPGLGRWIAEAIAYRDLPVVQGGLIVLGATFVVLNFIVDLCYTWLDPRIRLH